MALSSPNLPIITLNVTGLNSPFERHRVDGWIKNKTNQTHVYAAYKRLTSALWTHMGSKWSDRKGYTMEMIPKESQGSYTFIRQNRL